MPKKAVTLDCSNLSELPSIAKKIVDFAEDQKVWLFEGEMGAGKTTLIRFICEEFAVEDNVNSPTFSIVNEYGNSANEIFYHFDFYRFEKEEEAVQIGVEEYFDSGDICFVEWPEKVNSYLPEEYLIINISKKEEQARTIQLNHHNGRSV